MKEYLLFFFLLLGLCSCSEGWNKDAFADESEAVKNAVPFQAYKRKIPPPDKNVIFMNFSPVYTVEEGETLTIPIQYTIGHPEVIFQKIEVQDADSFPGLVHDRDAQVISITPPDETVDISSRYKLRPLEIALFAKYEGVVLQSIARVNIMIVPRRDDRGVRPEVIKVIGFPEETHPGGDYEFKVYVKGSTEQPPRLQVYSETGASKYFVITHNHENPSNGLKNEKLLKNCDCAALSDEEGLDIWEFVVSLKLPKGIKIFTQNDVYKVRFVAYSMYGIPSKKKNTDDKNFNVFFEDPPEPELIGDSVVYFRKGIWNSYTFLVLDTFQLIKVSSSCTVPQGATCQCDQHKFYSVCSLIWKPDVIEEFEVEVQKMGQIFEGDELLRESLFIDSFRVRVVEPDHLSSPSVAEDSLPEDETPVVEVPGPTLPPPPADGASSAGTGAGQNTNQTRPVLQ